MRDEDGVRTVTVAGRIVDEHVPGLLAACAQAHVLRVDLSDVLSIDAIAADALRRIRDSGAELVGAPTYIQLKLDSVAPAPRRL